MAGWDDVSLLLGNGDGTLQFPIQFFLGESFDHGGVLDAPGGLAVADFDGNGGPDLSGRGSEQHFPAAECWWQQRTFRHALTERISFRK